MAKSFTLNPFTGNLDIINAVTLTAVGSSPNANAASIDATTQALTLQPADASNPGVLTTGTQTIAGQKTFSTGITGTLTGHATLDLALTGGTMSGALDMGSHLIHNVTDPVVAQDAATKAYVDAAFNPSLYLLKSANLSDVASKSTSFQNLLPTLTSGSVIFSDGTTLAQDNSNFVWDNTNKRLSLGGHLSTAALGVTSSGSQVALSITSSGTNTAVDIQNQGAQFVAQFTNATSSATQGAAFGGAFARGTLGAKTAVQAGDQVCTFSGQSYNGSSFGPGYNAAIVIVATENQTATNNGGEIVFATTPNGALAPVAGLIVNQDQTLQLPHYTTNGFVKFTGAAGTLGVDTGTYLSSLTVSSANGFAGSSSGGATPALTLSTTITGILKGNGTAISAATSGTDYSAGTSALATGILKSTTTTGALTIAVAGDFPTLNQNTTGTAANVTGIVTLTHGGTGNALSANGNRIMLSNSGGTAIVEQSAITASRALISDASGLPVASTTTSGELGFVSGVTSAIQTQLNGKQATITNLAPTLGGTGIITYATGDTLYASASNVLSARAIGSTGDVLTVAGGVPTWAAPSSGTTSNYWSGYTATTASWSTTSGSFVNGTNSGGNTLTTRISNGITVTAGASNVAGITFTPAASTSIYNIRASFPGCGTTGGATAAFQLTDGTNVITTSSNEVAASGTKLAVDLEGLYAPGTGSAVTVKVQLAAIGGGTTSISDPTAGLVPVIEWQIIQIK